MKSTILCLAVIAQIALLSLANAEPIQKIPLYYNRKRTNKKDFLSSEAQDLKNGMLGGIVQIGNPPQNLTMAFDTSTGFSWVRGVQCGDDVNNCQGRNAFDSRNSTTIISTGQSFNMNYGGGAIVYTTIYLDTFRFSGLTVKNMPFGGAYKMEGFNQGLDGYLGLGRDVDLNSNKTQHYAKRDIPASGFVPNAYQQGSGLQSAQFGMYTTSAGSGFSDSGSVVSNNVANNPTVPMNNNNSNNGPSTNAASDNSANTAAGGSSTNTNTAGGSTNTNTNAGVTSGGFGHVKRHHYHDDDYDEPAGYLVIGGIDYDAIKGKLYHINVKDDDDSGNWAIPVHEAKFIDDLHFEVSKNAKAILSSSTDVIGLPNKQADEFKKHWYAEYDKPDNTYKIPCCLMDRITAFKIRLGNVNAIIPPHYWSHPRKVDTCCEMCRTHIGRSDSDTDYVIGSAFTNAFYTQFDSEKDRISLGMKKNHVKDGLSLCEA